jgi:hypothetical protein
MRERRERERERERQEREREREREKERKGCLTLRPCRGGAQVGGCLGKAANKELLEELHHVRRLGLVGKEPSARVWSSPDRAN